MKATINESGTAGNMTITYEEHNKKYDMVVPYHIDETHNKVIFALDKSFFNNYVKFLNGEINAS